MKKAKQITAIAGIILLLSLYVVSLISAIAAKPYANSLFTASLFCTIVIPVVIYGFMVIYKAVHKKPDDEVKLTELKKKNKELENQKNKTS